METLPQDMIYTIALKMPFSSLKSFCAVNKRYATVCSNKKFWIDKLQTINIKPEANLSLTQLKNLYQIEEFIYKLNGGDLNISRDFWKRLQKNENVGWKDLIIAFRYAAKNNLAYLATILADQYTRQYPNNDQMDLFEMAVQENSVEILQVLLEKFPLADLLTDTRHIGHPGYSTLFDNGLLMGSYDAVKHLLEYLKFTQPTQYKEALLISLDYLIAHRENIPLALKLIETAPKSTIQELLSRNYGVVPREISQALLIAIEDIY